jgi:hypothetical protein
MLKALACCLTLLAIAIGGPAAAQPSANGTHSTNQHDVTLSGSDYEETVVAMAKLPELAGSSEQALLTAMETWVSSQFDLPAIHEHPRIEFAPPARLKYECPQEREKLAYIAQDRWLGLFGHSLSDDFALDPFSLFVKTTCFY